MVNRKNIISIETSSNICGVSFIKGGNCIKTIEEDSERKHVEKIPIFYKKLKDEIEFKNSEISAIAVSIGPGSFTGLRIGLSFAKGLALAQSLPIVPIPTMMSLAFSQKQSRPTIGLIHSHGDRVFCQKILWSNGIPKPLQDIEVLNWQNFLENLDKMETVFHTNCDKLIDKEKFISAKLSSISVGILAYEMFEDLVIKDPTNLISNYVSPFNINK
tara:strand:+ start:328 stop:975 length:648 start_codon:yes stop_codon:yes gene_type:complete